ncbi:hypothetical protein Hanom_Chr13g01202501 [Helianthus anomalus]
MYASLIKEAIRIQKLPEHILVMGKINTLWPEPGYYPTIRWNREGQLCFLFGTQLMPVIKVVLVQRHWSKHSMFLHFVLFRWWPVTRGRQLVRAVFRFLKKGVRRLFSMVPSIYLLRTKIR